MRSVQPQQGQADTSDRVVALIAEMSLTEKLKQLIAPLRFKFCTTEFDDNDRLGIPVMYAGECLHGAVTWGDNQVPVTVFPQALALASTWNPALVEEVATAVAKEVRLLGSTQAYGPVLDVARDARFGRTEETYGEDPYLVSALGVACVHGLQGRDEHRFDHEHVLATAKHFIAYHDGVGGLNGDLVDISERTIREVHLPPFRAAIQAGIGAIMPGHSDMAGVPMHAHRVLLTEVLREELGFDGLIVSDNRDVGRLFDMHRIAGSRRDAAVLALTAGVDQELVMQDEPRCYAGPLASAVTDGEVDVSLVDRSVEKVLRAKESMGLLDGPARPVDVDFDAHRVLAREAASQSITLLKNNDSLLPLSPDAVASVAIIGPNADARTLGGYTSDVSGDMVTVLEGMRQRLPAGAIIRYERGCDITGDPTDSAVQASISAASAAAEASDIAIVVLGDSTETVGEGTDRAVLDLPGAQQDLIEAVVSTGTPTVVLLLCGRPPAIPWIAEHVPAVLIGWFLGLETGTAVAQVIFGDRDPGGKLPVTIPRSTGQAPLTYQSRPRFTGTGQGFYSDVEQTPLWPFGHGMSFTTFELATPVLEKATMRVGDSTVVSCRLRNTGTRSGDEVVQLYIGDDIASVGRPLARLRGFERVTLAPGEEATVQFTVLPHDLELLDVTLQPVVEPGTFTLSVGLNSATTNSTTLLVEAAINEETLKPRGTITR